MRYAQMKFSRGIWILSFLSISLGSPGHWFGSKVVVTWNAYGESDSPCARNIVVSKQSSEFMLRVLAVNYWSLKSNRLRQTVRPTHGALLIDHIPNQYDEWDQEISIQMQVLFLLVSLSSTKLRRVGEWLDRVLLDLQVQKAIRDLFINILSSVSSIWQWVASNK